MSKRRHHILGWLVLIACVGALLIVLLPMMSHHSAPKPSDLEGKDRRLTILTWNTHQMGQFRKPAENEVLRYLLQQDADVICLQEVDVYKTPEFLTLPEVKQVLSSKYAFSYIDFAVYNQRRQFGNMSGPNIRSSTNILSSTKFAPISAVAVMWSLRMILFD